MMMVKCEGCMIINVSLDETDARGHGCHRQGHSRYFFIRYKDITAGALTRALRSRKQLPPPFSVFQADKFTTFRIFSLSLPRLSSYHLDGTTRFWKLIGIAFSGRPPIPGPCTTLQLHQPIQLPFDNAASKKLFDPASRFEEAFHLRIVNRRHRMRIPRHGGRQRQEKKAGGRGQVAAQEEGCC